jgi:hypothetical protein
MREKILSFVGILIGIILSWQIYLWATNTVKIGKEMFLK